MIILETTLTSWFILTLREIERVTNYYFFALKSVQNASFEKEVFTRLEKVKVAVFDEEGEKGPQISCVSYANMCFESIGAYMDL